MLEWKNLILKHFENIERGIIAFCGIFGLCITVYAIIKKRKILVHIIFTILLLLNMGIMLLF